MTPQYFNPHDPKERKFDMLGEELLTLLSMQRSIFFEESFQCFVLGEVLYDTDRSPLANAIKREIFRSAFAAIFEAFIVGGSFDSYLTVFQAIFGEDVVVTFEVPGPGKLKIDIVAAGFELSTFVADRIVSNAYVFDEIVDDDGDTIVFQTIKGFQTQYELEQMLFEMVPGGIYTEITLTVGG